MQTEKPLRFGIKTSPQDTGFEAILDTWLEAEEYPAIEHAWINDHFISMDEHHLDAPSLESWTVLTALGARTSRLRLGIMVMSNTYRNPAVLAKMAATLDVITHGRLDFGLGAGWYEREHISYDLPFYTTAERIRRLDEACKLIKRMWTEKAPNFQGTYYQLKEAYCEPKPLQKPHPPIMIGGSGEKLTLRVVARHADMWNYISGTPEEFRHKSSVLDRHCTAIGRDTATIERSVQAIINLDNLKAERELLARYIDSGATHLILSLRPPFVTGTVKRLVTELVEPLQEQFLH